MSADGFFNDHIEEYACNNGNCLPIKAKCSESVRDELCSGDKNSCIDSFFPLSGHTARKSGSLSSCSQPGSIEMRYIGRRYRSALLNKTILYSQIYSIVYQRIILLL